MGMELAAWDRIAVPKFFLYNKLDGDESFRKAIYERIVVG